MEFDEKSDRRVIGSASLLLFCQLLGIRVLTPLGVLPGAAVGLRS